MKLWPFKPRIQVKLTLAFLVMGLVPMLLSTFITIKLNAKRVDKEIRQKLENALLEFDNISLFYQKQAKLEAENLAQNPQFKSDLPALEAQAVTRVLRIPGTGKPTIIWEPGRMEGMNYEKNRAEATLTILHIQAFKSKVLASAAVLPVWKEDKVIGNVIVAYLLERVFTEELENRTGVNIRIDPEPFSSEGETKTTRDIPFTPEIREKVLQEKSSYYTEKAYYKKEPYQALYQPIFGSKGEIKGVIFFGVPKRYTFRSVVGPGQFWFGLILLGIFMAATLGYTIARRISKRINLFADAARSVAKGNLDKEIKLKGKDEIGDLASAFNLMTGKLRQMRTLEAKLRRQDRLAALGELSAGVAHEIRNPLGIIKNSAQVLQGKLKGKETKSRELTNFIIEETDRLNNVVSNFLDFARPQKPSLEKKKVPPLLDKALKNLNGQLSEKKIKINKNYEKNLPSVMIDQELILQVFLNLIINAIQAMPKGGLLKINSENDSGKFLKISFSDTGCGITRENLSKIFNPFFSIREGGVGLGLSIVHKIIESHGGEISAESKPGQGTIFTLKFPVNIIEIK